MERLFRKHPVAEKVVHAFHNGGADEQHHFNHAEPELEQAALEQENRNKRQHAGQRQHDAHINRRLHGFAGSGFQRKGIQPELSGLAGEPRKRSEKRNGHKRRDNQHVKRLDSLYHRVIKFYLSNICSCRRSRG